MWERVEGVVEQEIRIVVDLPLFPRGVCFQIRGAEVFSGVLVLYGGVF
jgi:hypothetical protein